jgi:hypothetical protein
MRNNSLVGFLGYVVAGAIAAMLPMASVADGGGRYVEVTLTNITPGQIISPVVVASHSGAFEPLFELGAPASPELAGVAEDADLEPLVTKLEADPTVHDVQVIFGQELLNADGPIAPGESASVVLEVRGGFRDLSLVAMLVTTNAAFTGVNGLRAPARGARSVHAVAYDAGSEANNELCQFIPGPPCGNPGMRAQDGAEGFVHVHSGIHGVGDLEAADHDWRNPVARITVRRVRHAGDLD